MAGDVEVEPAIAEDPRLEAAGVRDGDAIRTPPGSQQPGRLPHRRARARHVLERVPEDHRGPAVAALDLLDREVEEVGSRARRARARSPRGRAPRARRAGCRRRRRRRGSAPAARSSSRRPASSAARPRRGCASPGEVEAPPPVRGPVPAAVGGLELGLVGPGVGGGRAALRARGPARRAGRRSASNGAPHQTHASAGFISAARGRSRQTSSASVEAVGAELEVVGVDRGGPRVLVAAMPVAASRRRASAWPASARAGAAAADRGRAARSRVVPLGVEDLHVALRAEDAADLDPLEVRLAERSQLLGVELDVVVGVDDLVGPAEGQPVRGDEDRRRPSGSSTRQTSARTRSGSGTCSSDWTESTDGERAVVEGQLAHVGDDGLAVLAVQGPGVEVDADRLARREQVIAVADAAAEIEHPAVGRGRARRSL